MPDRQYYDRMPRRSLSAFLQELLCGVFDGRLSGPLELFGLEENALLDSFPKG